MAHALLELNDLKIALNIPIEDDSKNALLNLAIEGASVAVQNYTQRDFGEPLVTEDREFVYDGRGYIDIPDAATVNSVTLQGRIIGTPQLLDPEKWIPLPHEGPVYYWIELPTGLHAFSPQMGFTRNLDKYDSLPGARTVARINAQWGWPTVPSDVKQAVIWTAVSFYESPRPYVSESIEGYSRTIAAPTAAIPERAIKLLEPYIRIALV